MYGLGFRAVSGRASLDVSVCLCVVSGTAVSGRASLDVSECLSVCGLRYSALSGGAGMDMSDARNRSAGRSAAAAGGSSSLASAASVRDYQGRLSGPASRSSLTPRSSQERNFDTGTMTGIAR